MFIHTSTSTSTYIHIYINIYIYLSILYIIYIHVRTGRRAARIAAAREAPQERVTWGLRNFQCGGQEGGRGRRGSGRGI